MFYNERSDRSEYANDRGINILIIDVKIFGRTLIDNVVENRRKYVPESKEHLR